jgi:hypothetical protein
MSSQALPAAFAGILHEHLRRICYRLELAPETAEQLRVYLASEGCFDELANEAYAALSAERLAEEEIQVVGVLESSKVNHCDPKKPVAVQLKMANTPERVSLLSAMDAGTVRLVGRVRAQQMELVS